MEFVGSQELSVLRVLPVQMVMPVLKVLQDPLDLLVLPDLSELLETRDPLVEMGRLVKLAMLGLLDLQVRLVHRDTLVSAAIQDLRATPAYLVLKVQVAKWDLRVTSDLPEFKDPLVHVVCLDLEEGRGPVENPVVLVLLVVMVTVVLLVFLVKMVLGVRL